MVRGQPARFLRGHNAQRSPLAERFWARVALSDGCWEWTGRIDAKGYGRFKVRQVPLYAHRVAWELANGPLGPYAQIGHRCGNHRCVRVDHLTGPRQERQRDEAASADTSSPAHRLATPGGP